MDDLGLVKAIDRLSQSVVVAVTDAAHRGLDPGFGKAFGVLDGHILGGFNRSSQHRQRSEEHTSELQSLMRISYAVFCLKKITPPTDSISVIVASLCHTDHIPESLTSN